MLANAVVLVRVLQRNRANMIYIYFLKELLPAIMKAEKFQDLQSASWRPGRLTCNSSPKANRLKVQELRFQFKSKDQKRSTFYS